MKLTREDIIKFYYLKAYYNPTSPNIGVIGNEKEFKHRMKPIIKRLKTIKGTKFYQFNNKLTTIIGDIETTYIKIETVDDLVGKDFRKYM